MSKYIDAEKLIAEIKRYKNKADERLKIKGRTYAEEQKDLALQNLCGNLLHFISSLQQEQPEGENMNLNIPERIFLWEDEIKEFLIGKRKEVQIGINQFPMCGLLTYVRKNVKQKVEQPEVDLEKEIDRFMESVNDEATIDETAKHFFELGRNARKKE